MKKFDLIVKSKNKNILNNFFLFLKENNLNQIQKCFPKKTKYNRLTILKSPHVNKKAQEQFEKIIFKNQIILQINKHLKYWIFLKNLNFNLFADVSIKLKYKINNKDSRQIKLKTFNLNNFKFKKYQNLKNYKKILTIFNKTHILLSVLDLHGEFLKNLCLNSSVGRVKYQNFCHNSSSLFSNKFYFFLRKVHYFNFHNRI